jgi:hypothetical protein
VSGPNATGVSQKSLKRIVEPARYFGGLGQIGERALVIARLKRLKTAADTIGVNDQALCALG